MTMTTACGMATEPRGSRRAVPLFWSACLVFVVGCGPPTGDGPGHRPQALALDPYQEANLGKQAYDEVLNQYRAKDRVVAEGDPDLELVRTIGRKIVRASENEYLQREINLRV